MVNKLLLVALVFAVASCGNSEQEEAAARLAQHEKEINAFNEERRKEAEERERQREAEKQQEPEKPAEPQYEEKDVYVLIDQRTECEDKEVEACGLTFFNCSNEVVYGCMNNIKYSVKTIKKKVE